MLQTTENDIRVLDSASFFISIKYRMHKHDSVKSSDCLKNDHGQCQGFTKETKADSSTITQMCVCPCHDPMYQLVRNSLGLVNQSARNNPYQFTSGSDDV
jgi:hypothetical protein